MICGCAARWCCRMLHPVTRQSGVLSVHILRRPPDSTQPLAARRTGAGQKGGGGGVFALCASSLLHVRCLPSSAMSPFHIVSLSLCIFIFLASLFLLSLWFRQQQHGTITSLLPSSNFFVPYWCKTLKHRIFSFELIKWEWFLFTTECKIV